jgi:DNA-binding HxlR family transcriptional regulator
MPKKRSNCPLSFSLDIFGDKWSLLIIRDIIMMGKFSFIDFSKSAEKIASNILASRLELLEKEGIIYKQVSPKNKSKYIYSLTKKGIDLQPVLIEMMKWGAKYNSETPVPPKKIIEEYEEDNKSLLRKYRTKQKDILNQ